MCEGSHNVRVVSFPFCARFSIFGKCAGGSDALDQSPRHSPRAFLDRCGRACFSLRLQQLLLTGLLLDNQAADQKLDCGDRRW